MLHLRDIIYLLPELILGLGAIVLLIAGVMMNKAGAETASANGAASTGGKIALIGRKNWLIGGGAVAVLGLALLSVIVQSHFPDNNQIMGGFLRIDAFGRVVKLFILAAAALAVLIGWRWLLRQGIGVFELPILMLFAVVGMCQMVAANNFIVLFLGLELQNLALYVLAASGRDNRRSSEAGLKYFVLGALSSGLLLYGISMIYGFSGTVSYDALANHIGAQNGGAMPYGMLIGFVFVLIGIGFKISAVPFHMWTPDVYEGSPTPITNFFAVVPKLAGFAVMMRLLAQVFGGFGAESQQILMVLAAASMILGAVAAVNQRNIKRLMAYSAISHVGYGLIGLVGNGVESYASTLVYLGIYIPMTLGTFGCILVLTRGGKPLEALSDLAGLAKFHPILAACLAVFMFSMAGIPPLAGFFGKFYVFRTAMHNNLIGLAVIGVLSSVVAAFYYCRIIKLIYFDPPPAHLEAGQGSLDPLPREIIWVIGLTALVLVLFVFWPNEFIEWVRSAAGDLWNGSE